VILAVIEVVAGEELAAGSFIGLLVVAPPCLN
jgi:hypothetical protein